MHPVHKFMFKAENKNAVLKIPHLDGFSENFVSHSVFGDKFGKIVIPWEKFVGTFGVCECKSETCLDWPPDVSLRSEGFGHCPVCLCWAAPFRYQCLVCCHYPIKCRDTGFRVVSPVRRYYYGVPWACPKCVIFLSMSSLFSSSGSCTMFHRLTCCGSYG
jgi:hypothetical protein